MQESSQNVCEKPKCSWTSNPTFKRFIALVFICSIGFLASSAYDAPGSLETQIEETFNIHPYEFEYLYSFYSFPNIFLCFFSGLLIDRVFGVEWASLIIAAVGLLGQIIIVAGGFTKIYWVMLLGRFIYGVGGDSLGVVLCYYTVLWFSGNELSFVFGMLLCISRLGTSFIFLISTPIYVYSEINGSPGNQLGVTLSPVIVFLALLLVILMALAWLSKRNGKLDRKKVKVEGKQGGAGATANCGNILRFPFKFWLVTIILTLFNTAVIVFVSCSQQLLMSKYGLEAEEANRIGSVFNLVGALSSPIPGIIVDKLGRQLFFTMIGLVMGIVSQIILALTLWNPYIPTVILAISFGILNSTVPPLTSLVVPPTYLATAYGMSVSIANLSLTISNVYAGYLLGHFGFIAPCLFYLTCLVLGLICLIILWVIDRKGNGILNMSARKKRIHIERKLTTKISPFVNEGYEMESIPERIESEDFHHDLEYHHVAA